MAILDAVLVGLVDIAVSTEVLWDMSITMRGGSSRADFEKNLKREFRMGLAGIGIRMGDSALGRLECSVDLSLLEDPEPVVVVSRTVRLLLPTEVIAPTGHWSVVWSRGETTTVRRNVLSGSESGRECAWAFRRDWLRANPSR
jgi:hypothetical protein